MRLALSLALPFFIFQSPLSQAVDEGVKKMPEMTREEHAKRADRMAEAHKKMAECLRTDKSIAECHEQMQKECPMAKEGHCPMTDQMCGRKGMHRMHGKGRMMKQNGSDPETEK